MANHSQHYMTAADGTRLGYRLYPPDGDGTAIDGALPVICLPGLTRNARDFHPLALRLLHESPSPRRIVSIDYRGRGASAWAADKGSYNVLAEAQDLLAVLSHLQIGRALFIGTSRGGLILHVLAAMAPERLAGIVFNDIGPELGLDGLRQIQDYLREPVALASWEAACAELKRVHGAAFPALTEEDWTEMARAIYTTREGAIVADCDPAICAAFAAADLDAPLPALWAQFDQFPDIPMLVVRGEHSRLLTDETIEEMKRRRPRLQRLLAKGHGHAPLLHSDEIAGPLTAFLTGRDLA